MEFLYLFRQPRQADPELADVGVRLLRGNVGVSKARLERVLFGNSAKAVTVSFWLVSDVGRRMAVVGPKLTLGGDSGMTASRIPRWHSSLRR